MLVVPEVGAERGALLDPRGAPWKPVAAHVLALKGTPTGIQPTAYTRSAWKDRKIGAVARVSVQLCHDDESMFVRLEWADPTENRSVEDSNIFPDGAAVVFPILGDAPIDRMGSDAQPVNAWQWQADLERGRSVVARGIGTTEPTDDVIDVAAARGGNGWQVVIARKLAGSANGTAVSLRPGETTRVGVAIWEGSNGERAGFKAFTEDWTEIRLADGA